MPSRLSMRWLGARFAGGAGATAAKILAAALLAMVWGVQREGGSPSDLRVSRAVGVAIAVVGVLVVWGSVTVSIRMPGLPPLPFPGGEPAVVRGCDRLRVAVPGRRGRARPCRARPRAAADSEPLRVARLIGAYTLVITAVTGFLVVGLLSEEQRRVWMSAPLAGVAIAVAAPAWIRFLLLLFVASAAVVFLASTVRAACERRTRHTRAAGRGRCARPRVPRAASALRHAVANHRRVRGRATRHPARLGRRCRLARADTPSRWSARRCSSSRRCGDTAACAEKRAYRVPLTVTVKGREWPIGLLAIAVLLAIPTAALIVMLDPPTLACAVLVNAVALVLIVSERELTAQAPEAAGLDEFQLLPSDDVDLAAGRRAAWQLPRAGPQAARDDAPRRGASRRRRSGRRRDDRAARRRRRPG